MARRLRVVALLATFNEERFVGSCIEHLATQGVSVYLIDNDSTDETVARAERHLGRGLVGIERLPRNGEFSLTSILQRKEELARTLEADWFIHHDADEIRAAPRGRRALADALTEIDAAGYNAVNFLEFTFVPTTESPRHDHPRFTDSMRHYYPFLPSFPHRLGTWKRQSAEVDLTSSAGHQLWFPGLRMWPESFPMRHYLFLSPEHAYEKYAGRLRTRSETAQGWGGWRTSLATAAQKDHIDLLRLPRPDELRPYLGDALLDPSEPLTVHHWIHEWAERIAVGTPGAET